MSSVPVHSSVPGLAGWWHFDEGLEDGVPVSPTKDEAYGNDGTLIGGATYDDNGKFGRALSLDGSDDYVSVADHAALDITDEITIKVWIYPEVINTYKTIVAKGDAALGGINYGLQIQAETTPGKIRFFINNGVAYVWFDCTATVSVNTWSHIAVTFDDTTDAVNCYVNGAAAGSGSIATQDLTANGESLDIGRHRHLTLGASQYFDGLIDELEIWNRELTAAEIADNYALEGDVLDPNLVKPGIEDLPIAGLVFFTASFYGAPNTVRVCVEGSGGTNTITSITERANSPTPRGDDTFTPGATGGKCVVITGIDFFRGAKTIHFVVTLNTGETVGVNIQKNPLS